MNSQDSFNILLDFKINLNSSFNSDFNLKFNLKIKVNYDFHLVEMHETINFILMIAICLGWLFLHYGFSRMHFTTLKIFQDSTFFCCCRVRFVIIDFIVFIFWIWLWLLNSLSTCESFSFFKDPLVSSLKVASLFQSSVELFKN